MNACCCGPSSSPVIPGSGAGAVQNFDPTIALTVGAAGLDVTGLTDVELAVSGRLSAWARTGTVTVTGSNNADTIGGTVAGQAVAPVSVTTGDDDATASALATALDGLTDVTATAASNVVTWTIARIDDVGFDLSVTGAAGTTIAIVADAEEARVRFLRRLVASGGDLNDWQVFAANVGPRADYANLDISDGFAAPVLDLSKTAALYAYATDLAGDAADAAGITYRCYGTLTPLR